jgi:hypothetical protein
MSLAVLSMCLEDRVSSFLAECFSNWKVIAPSCAMIHGLGVKIIYRRKDSPKDF